VLGVEPRLGRGFTEEEAEQRLDVVMLSSELWQRRYGADPDIVGAGVGIEGESYDVVGVLPRGLDVPQDLARAMHADVWFPLKFPPARSTSTTAAAAMATSGSGACARE
jgi:hypothetical protein